MYTAYLLKLAIQRTNAVPRSLSVETKTKRTLYSSRRLSFNEIRGRGVEHKQTCAA